MFPSAQGFGALDLRGAAPAPQPGDVTPREQDEYVFLETLLSARERLTLSYVARDATTGERKDPSSTLLALRDVLGAGTGGDELLRGITRKDPPLARHRDDAVCAVLPAAARERQAAALGASLRRAAGVIQLPEPEHACARRCPRRPGPRSGRRSATVALAARAETSRRAVDTLTLADLRRFLECPLQGSVRVLLPMRGEDDAEDEAEAALRERENLGDLRVQTVPLLRDLFARALDAGATDDAALAERYDAATAGLRLDGTLPSGVFGAVLRVHHLTLLRSWREGLREALKGELPTGLAPIWYGRGARAPARHPDRARDPAGGAAARRTAGDGAARAERAAGALDGGQRTAMTLVGSRRRDYIERDRLRAWLTHLAVAASGADAAGPLEPSCWSGRARRRSGHRRQRRVRAHRGRRRARAAGGSRRRDARRRARLPDAVRRRVHVAPAPAQGPEA